MSSSKRILGIVGSPRKGSNTHILVERVLEGAKSVGAEPKKITLSELDIRPCRACDSCLKTGQCVQKDDFEIVLEEMKTSHGNYIVSKIRNYLIEELDEKLEDAKEDPEVYEHMEPRVRTLQNDLRKMDQDEYTFE